MSYAAPALFLVTWEFAWNSPAPKRTAAMHRGEVNVT
jgi:hypothetical protein